MVFDANFLVDVQNLLRPQVITGNGTGIDTPMSTAARGVLRVIVFVGDLSAGTVFTPIVQTADDDGVWSDLVTLPAISAANSGTAIGLDEAKCKRFLRLRYTAIGGTPNLVATGFFLGGRVRVN
jgi:hypothetical protein